MSKRFLKEKGYDGNLTILKEDVELLLDEYAKQECVDFAGFIAAEYFIHPNGVTFYHYRKSIRGGECMQEDELTKEHLYELYEQSKNKQQ